MSAFDAAVLVLDGAAMTRARLLLYTGRGIATRDDGIESPISCERISCR